MPTENIDAGQPLRIGKYLRVTTGESSAGLWPPDDWPGKPTKPKPITKEYVTALMTWGLSFTKKIWSYFDLWASFTDDGKQVAFVKITEALEHKVEEDPNNPGWDHVSAQLNPSTLTKILTEKLKKKESVYWNDLHEIEVTRKLGEAGEVPEPNAEVEDGKPPGRDEIKRRTILKDFVDRIENQTFDVDFKVKNKPR